MQIRVDRFDSGTRLHFQRPPVPATWGAGRAELAFYRIVLTLFTPLVVLLLAVQWLRGRETLADLRERLAAPGRVPGRPAVWLHAASNGEVAAARPLVDRLLAGEPALGVVLTANTPGGREVARSWGLARVEARLAPLDFRWTARRFLDAFRPAALVTVENEIWPNRLLLAKARGVPLLVAGARLSAGSARNWGRVPGLARQVLGAIDHLAAQDADSEARFEALGLPPDRLGPRLSLKASVRMAPVAGADLAPFAALPRARTWLAASTHEGEEEAVLDAFVAARAQRPGLRLILAPRHPRRGDEVAALVDSRGLRRARRSAGEVPGPETEVYLADTLGEMRLWYALAPVTLVGGSLVEKGGHTPFEPAQFDSAILHGPHVANAAEPYRALDAAGAAVAVADATGLAGAVARLLGDEAARGAMAARATEVLGGLAGDDVALAAFAAHVLEACDGRAAARGSR